MDKALGQPPAELKVVLPYVQRANELRVADPVIAYWCCYYAAQLGIGANAQERDAKLYLLDLMDTLEALRSQLADNDAVLNDTASSAYVENFALKVFVGADNEDRAGKATRGTAKKFLIATHFLELLSIFGPLHGEMQDKVRYAKWKAADVAKAFKEGRVPQPGPAGGDDKQESADIETAIAAQPVDSKAEEEYLAREMAKLVAPAPETLSMSRSSSASKVRRSIDGGAISPNFSNRLQPQPPNRSDEDEEQVRSVPLPSPPVNIGGGDTWNHAVMGQNDLADNTDINDDAMFPRSPGNAPVGARPMPFPHSTAGPGTAPPPFWGTDAEAGASDSSVLPSVPSGPPDASLDRPPAIVRIDPVTPSAPSFDEDDSKLPDIPSTPSALPPPSEPPRPVAPPKPIAPPPVSVPRPVAHQTPVPVQRTQPTAPSVSSEQAFPEELSAKLSTRVQKLAKGAASAVDFEDLDTARIQLRQALDILEGRVTS